MGEKIVKIQMNENISRTIWNIFIELTQLYENSSCYDENVSALLLILFI